jgi:hypothetical protein
MNMAAEAINEGSRLPHGILSDVVDAPDFVATLQQPIADSEFQAYRIS